MTDPQPGSATTDFVAALRALADSMAVAIDTAVRSLGTTDDPVVEYDFEDCDPTTLNIRFASGATLRATGAARLEAVISAQLGLAEARR